MFRKRKIQKKEIYLDEIFLDAKNIPQFDTYQMEGRIEKPIRKKSFLAVAAAFMAIGLVFSAKIFSLQVVDGDSYYSISENNRLNITYILPNRGIIYDKNGEKLAWNDLDSRIYISKPGLGHILGYVGLPSEKDLEGDENMMMKAVIGKEGVEKMYNGILFGAPGSKIVEVDSQDNVISESVQDWGKSGGDLNLSIDSKIQSRFFEVIDSIVKDRGFNAGAGVILDVSNGEILSLVSWPEYDPQVISKGEDKEKINKFLGDARKPFLNRAIAGLYAPGSIIKPLVALAALNEGVISPEKKIYSAGYISLPNPYSPGKYSIFKDWKAHGWVDMRRALAVSSDVYFYEIGGGFEGQKGLGISKIGEYTKKFGFESLTGIDLFGEEKGLVPTPEWHEENSEDPVWRIGDTYNASIGQGAFQVTPIQMAVWVSAIANNGKIFKPHLVKGASAEIKIDNSDIPSDYYNVVREGMRMSVTEGTAMALSTPSVRIAAKTGTAEIGAAKKYVNSWVVGFFPYEKPRYAFAVVMERGSASNLVGAPFAMRQVIDWMSIYTPEYFD